MANKATKTASTGSKYVNLITKSDSEVQAEQVGFAVDRAKNSLEKAILDVKGKTIDEQGKVSEAKLKLKDAQSSLERAKSSNPFNAQALINAFQAQKQAQLDLESAEESQKAVAEVLDFLQTTESELF